MEMASTKKNAYKLRKNYSEDFQQSKKSAPICAILEFNLTQRNLNSQDNYLGITKYSESMQLFLLWIQTFQWLY